MAKKPVKVKFLNDEIEREYLALPDNDLIKKRIDFVITKLKEMPQFGQPIPKRLIPEKYTSQGITSAYWVELNKRGSRLIYSLTSDDENEILAIILEWFTRHKDYDKRFGYN